MELEGERDQLKERLESEILSKEGLAEDRSRELDQCREQVRHLEEQVFRLESLSQQHKNELVERDRVIKEKSIQLEERVRLYDELNNECEKKRKQVESLRASVKARDDALIELNNKHKSLLSQFENNSLKLRSCSPPTSPVDDYHTNSMGQRSGCLRSPGRSSNPLEWGDKGARHSGQLQRSSSRDVKEYSKVRNCTKKCYNSFFQHFL